MTPVASPLIAQHWPRIWPMIEMAVIRGGEHTAQSVMLALIHGGMVLWIDAERIEDARAAVVTSWCDFPAGRIGYVLFAGGQDAARWLPDAADALTDWARGMGCKEIRVVGRRGWARLLGIKPTAYTYARSL